MLAQACRKRGKGHLGRSQRARPRRRARKQEPLVVYPDGDQPVLRRSPGRGLLRCLQREQVCCLQRLSCQRTARVTGPVIGLSNKAWQEERQGCSATCRTAGTEEESPSTLAWRARCRLRMQDTTALMMNTPIANMTIATSMAAPKRRCLPAAGERPLASEAQLSPAAAPAADRG